MKLGLLTAILDEHDNEVKYTYEEAIDFAAQYGFPAIECASWPSGDGKNRRYAGVCHIDAEKVNADDAYAKYVLDYAKEKGVVISALGYYSNPLSADLQARNKSIAHLNELIKASAKLGVNMVTTFIGRDQNKTVDDNLPLVKEVWSPILTLAEQLNVKIAIENCPMLFTKDQWPGGQNIMCTPANWEKVFDTVKSPNLGINYDPSHCVWQFLSITDPIYDFRDRMFHAHAKDIRLNRKALAKHGVMAYPLDIMKPVIPSHGDVDWGAFFAALADIGYDGYVALEIEDKGYEGSEAKVTESIVLAKRFLNNFVS